MAGDTDRMKLDTILVLDPKMKQIVQTPTQLNPDAILDPILMTLSTYYQSAFFRWGPKVEILSPTICQWWLSPFRQETAGR